MRALIFVTFLFTAGCYSTLWNVDSSQLSEAELCAADHYAWPISSTGNIARDEMKQRGAGCDHFYDSLDEKPASPPLSEQELLSKEREHLIQPPIGNKTRE